MNSAEKEMLLNQIELKVGLVKTFHRNKSGADDLIEVYEDIVKTALALPKQN